MFDKVYIGLAFIVGMLFMHSLNGEYARYGQYIDNEVHICEAETGDTCSYIVSPVHEVDGGLEKLGEIS